MSVQGVGKGFAPSAEAASAALGGTVRQDRHPSGVKGTTYSLNEMSRLIRDGRNDPRVRGWAGRVLMAAGKPKTVRGQAQAILDELRKKTVYVQDPVNTELIARPHVTLCLDDHGLCMPAADCDDLIVCLGSALLSLGLEARVLGQAYGTEQATHVILAVYDPSDGWLKIDPSSDSYPVGQCYPATKDWWVDPISGRTSSTVNGPAIHPGKEPEQGDFIGVGAVPFPHAFSVLAHGAAYVPVGMENPPPPGYCCNQCVVERRIDMPCPACFSILKQDEVSAALGQVPSQSAPAAQQPIVVRRRPVWPALITGAILGSLFVVIGVAIGESSK